MTIRKLGLLALPFVVGCAVSGDSGESQDSDEVLSGATPVYLNHAYGVESVATVEALQTNAYLKNQFVDVELRTTVSPGLTYTGTYLNTRETYLEYFADGAFYGYPTGVNGTALGDDVEGGLQEIESDWQGAFGVDGMNPIELRTREIDGTQVPWFNLVAPKWGDVSDYTGIWAMEYVPNAGSTAPRTRHEERAKRYDSSKLAQNVQAIVLGLPDGDRANMKKSLEAVHWKVVPAGAGFIARSPWDNGARRVIYAKPSSTGRIGMLGVVFRLNRMASHTEQLGDATLKVGYDGRPYAVLAFVPLTDNDINLALNGAQ